MGSRGNREQLLDTEAAARLLGCTPFALIKFRRERRGPPYIRVGKLIRYSYSDLQIWLNSHRVSPGAVRVETADTR